MIILKIFLKIAVLPAVAAVVILKWITVYLSSMTEWIFRILSLIIFLTAVLSFLMQLFDGKEAVGMLIGAFVVFMLPVGMAACAILLSNLQMRLGGIFSGLEP